MSVNVENRNVTVEAKFILAARELRKYINENLTGNKAMKIIKNKKGLTKSDLIFVSGMIFYSDFLPARSAIDRVLELCYLANALNPTIPNEYSQRTIYLRQILGELSYINSCLDTLFYKYTKIGEDGVTIVRSIPTNNFYKQSGLLLIKLENIIRSVLKSDKSR